MLGMKLIRVSKMGPRSSNEFLLIYLHGIMIWISSYQGQGQKTNFQRNKKHEPRILCNHKTVSIKTINRFLMIFTIACASCVNLFESRDVYKSAPNQQSCSMHGINPSLKSHNAPSKYPTHIYVAKRYIVWYGTGALWDLYERSARHAAGQQSHMEARHIPKRLKYIRF